MDYDGRYRGAFESTEVVKKIATLNRRREMKIPKKTIVLLGTALCIVLSGCGGVNPAESPKMESEETIPEPEEPTPESEEAIPEEEPTPESEEAISESEETASEPETETEMEEPQAAFSELPDAYQQMALYIQEGFRMYHVEGEYQAYFGPIESDVSGIWVDGNYIGMWDETLGRWKEPDSEYFSCDILLEGESGQWREEIAFTYDAEADWYAFYGQYEPLFSGDSSDAEWDGSSYAADILHNCVCQITIARDADIAAPIRYDSENGPMEKDLRMTPPWQFRDEDNGLSYQIIPRVYYYWDERLDVDIDIQYLQVELEEGQEEMEEAINEELRKAFFYGYDWDEEGNLLDPWIYTESECRYMITREDERYLSMRIHVYNSSRRAAHPNEGEDGITIDMRTGEVVHLEDLLGQDKIENDYTMGELLDRGVFRRLWGWSMDDRDWIEEMKEEYGDTLLSDFGYDFYMTDTSLGWIIYQYGNYYICLEADYEDLGLEGF